MMPMQGSLSIERMCQMARVSRAGFYRSLKERIPLELAKIRVSSG
jgi:putative transposase